MFYNLLQSWHDWLESFGGYSLLQVLYQIEFRAFFAVILSFAIVLLLVNEPFDGFFARNSVIHPSSTTPT